MPTHVGGIGFLNGRMILYALVLTVVWICAQRFGRELTMNLALLSILVGAVLFIDGFRRDRVLCGPGGVPDSWQIHRAT